MRLVLAAALLFLICASVLGEVPEPASQGLPGRSSAEGFTTRPGSDCKPFTRQDPAVRRGFGLSGRRPPSSGPRYDRRLLAQAAYLTTPPGKDARGCAGSPSQPGPACPWQLRVPLGQGVSPANRTIRRVGDDHNPSLQRSWADLRSQVPPFSWNEGTYQFRLARHQEERFKDIAIIGHGPSKTTLQFKDREGNITSADAYRRGNEVASREDDEWDPKTMCGATAVQSI